MKTILQRANISLVAVAILCACGGGPDEPSLLDRILDRDPKPDSLPRMLNAESPFAYPPELYAQKLQGNVSLRLFIDTAGAVNQDSTSVASSSGSETLDSAALVAARELKFAPAKRNGKPMAVSILFPVQYRHPDAPRLPSDNPPPKRGGGGS
jgi:protein TonB